LSATVQHGIKSMVGVDPRGYARHTNPAVPSSLTDGRQMQLSSFVTLPLLAQGCTVLADSAYSGIPG